MRQSQEGFLFITGLLMITSLLTLTAVGLTRSLTELKATALSLAHQQAFALAEAGLDDALTWLRSQPVPPLAPVTLGPRLVGHGSYQVRIEPDLDNPTEQVDYFTLTAQATLPASGVTTVAREIVQSDNVARFGMLEYAHAEPHTDVPFFVSGDTIIGPVHTNAIGGLSISGRPVLDGAVSSEEDSLQCENGCHPQEPEFEGNDNWPHDDPDFRGTLMLEAPRVPAPITGASFEKFRELAKTVGRYYPSPAWNISASLDIWLDGKQITITVRRSDTDQTETELFSVDDVPLIMSEDGMTLHGGELDGRLTLIGYDLVIVDGDVRYHCDPETLLPDSVTPVDIDCLNPATGLVEYNDDMLGLISSSTMQIRLPTVPEQRVVQGVVVGFFDVSLVDFGPLGHAPIGGLHLFGGLLCSWRAGSLDNIPWDKVPYQKYIRYDERLRSIAPPFFPSAMGQQPYHPVLWHTPSPD